MGNPTGLFLTPGQAHDLDGADVLLENTPADTVIADKAYDAQARVIEPLFLRSAAVRHDGRIGLHDRIWLRRPVKLKCS